MTEHKSKHRQFTEPELAEFVAESIINAYRKEVHKVQEFLKTFGEIPYVNVWAAWGTDRHMGPALDAIRQMHFDRKNKTYAEAGCEGTWKRVTAHLNEFVLQKPGSQWELVSAEESAREIRKLMEELKDKKQ